MKTCCHRTPHSEQQKDGQSGAESTHGRLGCSQYQRAASPNRPFHEIVPSDVTLHWQGVRLGSSRVNATPASTAAVPISFAEVVGSPRTNDATTIATMGTTFE